MSEFREISIVGDIDCDLNDWRFGVKVNEWSK